MKKLILIIFLYSIQNLTGQNQSKQEIWYNTFYDIDSTIYLKDMKLNSNNDIILLGLSGQPSNTTFDLISFNENGNLNWNIKNPGQLNIYRPLLLHIDSHVNYYVLGNHNYKQFIINYDNNANLLWELYSDSVRFYTSIIDSNDNIYSFVRFTQDTIYTFKINKYNSQGILIWQSDSITFYDFFINNSKMVIDSNYNLYLTFWMYGGYLLFKYDQNGNLIWNRIFPISWGQNDDGPKNIKIDKNGDIVITGLTTDQSYFYPYEITHILTLKYNSNGDLIWSNKHGRSPNQMLFDTLNNIYIIGRWADLENTIFCGEFLKYNQNGNLLWYKRYNNVTNFQASIINAEEKFLITGPTTTQPSNIITYKMNNDGQKEDSLVFDRNEYDYPQRIQFDNDNKILIAGKTLSWSGFDEKRGIVLIKYNTICSSLKNPTSNSFKLTINNYPNPFNSETTIQYEVPSSGFITLKIYDINGRYIEQLYSGYKPAGKHKINFSGKNFSSGVYFIQISSKQGSMIRKTILLK